MILSQYELLFFCISLLPAVYLSAQKNLFFTENPRYNLFILRFPFIIPPFLVIVTLPSYLLALLIQRLLPELSIAIVNIFGLYVASIIPLILSLLTIAVLKFVFSQTTEEVFPMENSPLFVFLPEDDLFDSRSLGTKYEIVNKSRKKEELIIRSQVTNLIIEPKQIYGKYMIFGGYGGEIIVSEEGLRILQEENLSGFITRSVTKHQGYPIFSVPKPDIHFKCYQLTCSHIMPPLSPPTEILIKKRPFIITVSKNKFYYKQEVLSEINDFNQSLEYFGGELFLFEQFSHRLWIVTKKTKDVLINRLEQKEKDFMPIYLVNDDGNVID